MIRLSGDDPLDLRPRPGVRWTVEIIGGTHALPLTLVLGTDDPEVVAEVERAARRAGIELLRLDDKQPQEAP